MLAIRSVVRLRKYLSKDNLKIMVNAFIVSHLDYCNSLYYGLPKREIDKLQSVQYCAARLVSGIRSDHITPVMKDFHWLNMGACTDFKILLSAIKKKTIQLLTIVFITCQILTGSFNLLISWFSFTRSSC